MTDGNLTLAVLAEKVGAEAVLRHAARAAKALSGAHITAVHVRVDPISTIMPTEEVLSDEQAQRVAALRPKFKRSASPAQSPSSASPAQSCPSPRWRFLFRIVRSTRCVMAKGGAAILP